MSTPNFDQKKALKAISERYTQEMRDDAAARNDVSRARIDPGSAQGRISRAAGQQRDIQEQIDFLAAQPPSELKTARLGSALDRLGELAAEQGNYDEAIEVTQDEKRRAYYQEVKHAITRTDSCDCQPERVMAPVLGSDGRVNTTDVTLPARTKIGTVVHPDGHLVDLERCRCGELYTNG